VATEPGTGIEDQVTGLHTEAIKLNSEHDL
jgi:hypothetical protein